jgi:hypothetical protein
MPSELERPPSAPAAAPFDAARSAARWRSGDACLTRAYACIAASHSVLDRVHQRLAAVQTAIDMSADPLGRARRDPS